MGLMYAIISGITLGSGNGLSPGPLAAMTISETLSKGFRGGLLVSIAPFLSDPIILGTTYLLVSFAATGFDALGYLGIIGGVFIIYLGYKTITFDGEVRAETTNGSVLRNAVILNLFNPYPLYFLGDGRVADPF